MKLKLISLIFISTAVGQLIPGIYTITNAQFTVSKISAPSQSRTSNRPEAAESFGGGFNALTNWEVRPVGDGQWSLQNSMNRQYLSAQGDTVGFSASLFPWKILALPGDLYVIRDSDRNGFAITLQSPNPGTQLHLLSATGAVTQNWVFARAS